ncbi:ROK family protein [Nocardia stercoris]|uniref:ROK family protein n=1 Tax=Nocardia stercoris TaxID=2483361 RepID=A0A3M2L030_9NOCA|nr:ROK family protein [Nocardia stercoris]RMI31032.1 ROK family protein [Nocardia stercoris]
MTVLALDVGATKLAAGVADGGQVRDVRRVPVPPNGVWAAAAGLLRTVAGDARVDAVGIGSAGPVDEDTGSVAPVNIPEWAAGFALVDAVRELFPAARVRLAIDGVCLTLAERTFGELRGVANGLAMTVSSGVGGGLLLDGRVAHGRTGNAGHIGHLAVSGSDEPCACGGFGCVEAVASGMASARWARAHGWTGTTGAELAAAAHAGDPVAVAALARAGDALGRAVASAAALLDLDRVVIGGGFAESGAPLWDPLHAAVTRHAGLSFVRGLTVVRSRISAGATLAGAALLAAAETGDLRGGR